MWQFNISIIFFACWSKWLFCLASKADLVSVTCFILRFIQLHLAIRYLSLQHVSSAPGKCTKCDACHCQLVRVLFRDWVADALFITLITSTDASMNAVWNPSSILTVVLLICRGFGFVSNETCPFLHHGHLT